MLTSILFVLSFLMFFYIVAHVPAMIYVKYKNPGKTVTFTINPVIYIISLGLMFMTIISFVLGL